MESALLFIAQLGAQFLAQSLGYFVLVGLVFCIVWKWGARRFDPRRVQKHKKVNRAQISSEVKHTLFTLAIGTINGAAIMALAKGGYTKLILDPQASSPFEIGLVVVCLVLFNDLWFYTIHRMLHTPWWFKHVHSVHHRSIDTNPFTSYSFHVVEALLLSAWTIPMFVCVPIPAVALAITMVIGTLNNVVSHLGYEFAPAWLLKVPILRHVNTATFHGLHHAKSRGNFGLFTRAGKPGSTCPQHKLFSVSPTGRARRPLSRVLSLSHFFQRTRKARGLKFAKRPHCCCPT